MTSEAPSFWFEDADWRAWGLWPFSAAYGFVAGLRMAAARREEVAAAVLCIGNFTLGGEGKTPVAIALAREAKRQKLRAGFLTRGYGGSISQPHLVNARKDSALLVGDESLLLARHAPTVVAHDRSAGARHLIDIGCDLIIMDDGFQSAHLHMDYALVVVDARRGAGNGHVFPGGPLRAPLTEQMRFADAIVTMGQGRAAETIVRSASRAGRPVFSARVKPRGVRKLNGARVMAFAGIGNPEKFFDTLRSIGAQVVATRSFSDHHPFSEEELEELTVEAAAGDLQLVTTEKDLVRLKHGQKAGKDFADSVWTLPVEAVFEEAGTAAGILRETLERRRERMLKGL